MMLQMTVAFHNCLSLQVMLPSEPVIHQAALLECQATLMRWDEKKLHKTHLDELLCFKSRAL